MGSSCPHAALPTLPLYCESVRLPIRRTVSLPLFGLSTASAGIEPALPSPCINPFGYPSWSQTPVRFPALTLCARSFSGFDDMKRLAFVQRWSISGLNPFTCITTGFLRPSGFTRFVASPRTEFCSELVVSLYSCWLPSSVNADFLGALISCPVFRLSLIKLLTLSNPHRLKISCPTYSPFAPYTGPDSV